MLEERVLPPAASHSTYLLPQARVRSPARSVPARHTTHSLAGAASQAPLCCYAPASAAATTAGTGGESDTIPGARRGEQETGSSAPTSPGWLALAREGHHFPRPQYTTRRRNAPASMFVRAISARQ